MRTLFKQYLSNKNIEFMTENQNVISFKYRQQQSIINKINQVD